MAFCPFGIGCDEDAPKGYFEDEGNNTPNILPGKKERFISVWKLWHSRTNRKDGIKGGGMLAIM